VDLKEVSLEVVDQVCTSGRPLYNGKRSSIQDSTQCAVLASQNDLCSLVVD